MLNAFYALKGNMPDQKKLADEAITLKETLCKEAGGWQDQIAASLEALIELISPMTGYEVLPVIISPNESEN